MKTLMTKIINFLIKDHAPVTKGLLLLNGSASLLNILLASSSIKRLIPSYEWIEVIHHLKVSLLTHYGGVWGVWIPHQK